MVHTEGLLDSSLAAGSIHAVLFEGFEASTMTKTTRPSLAAQNLPFI